MAMGKAVRAAFGLLAALALFACSPRTDDLEAGESAAVARVFDGDTLELEGGLRAQLTGIIAPRPDEPFGAESRAGLERLAAGREARLYYGGEKRLNDTIALAHVYVRTEGGRWLWLQEAMLREGLARVRVFKENPARAERLLRIEAKARAAKVGLWADGAYRVHDAQSILAISDGFHVVEGRILRVETREDRIYLNFGEDYRSDFTILIAAEDLPAWGEPALDPKSLEGKTVQVRGYVRDRGGPLIQIDHPAQMAVHADR